MFILKNAWKSITRTKGRSILIGIIVIAIAASSCVALSIRNSASKLVDSYQSSLDISATLQMNRDKLQSEMSSSGSGGPQEMMSKVPAITVDEINKYGDSKYVSSYYYTNMISMDSSNVTAVSNTSSDQSGFKPRGGGFGSSGDFEVTGYSSLKAMTNFIEGGYKVTSGSMFEDGDTANNCLISNELATANSLSVGSKITLTNPNDSTKTYEFTVVGIYKDTTTSSDSQTNIFSNAANQIITNATAVSNIVSNSSSNSDTAIKGRLNPTFNLTSSDVISKFTSEVSGKGLSEYYKVNTNADSVNQEITPIQNLMTFATTFLVLVLIIGGVILFILNMINIRERKYEIGVLRTIGMKKNKVLSQFVAELFIVTFMSLIIGTVIGGAISVPTANALLKSEISTQETKQTQIGENFGRPGMNFGGNRLINKNVSYVDQINANVNGGVILQIALIGLGLTIFSSSVAMIFISRYTPLRILSERT